MQRVARQVGEEKLQILLEQIGIPVHFVSAFQDGKIEEVVVLKHSKIWQFYFSFPNILDMEIFMIFEGKLKDSFQSLCEIDAFYHFETYTLDQLKTWVPFLLQKAFTNTPMFQFVLSESCYQIGEANLDIILKDDTQIACFRSSVLPELEYIFKKYGLEKFSFSVRRTEQKEQELTDFYMQRDLEDKAHIEKVIMQQNDQNNNGNKKTSSMIQSDSQILSDVVLIGYDLSQVDSDPIQSIVEEEARKVIQGYIFQLESRELKTGKILLTFKITDYTDSISCKMFSRDKTDVEIFSNIKKGMWVKVRGKVEEDSYARELSMFVRDFMEIQAPERKDIYPGETKRVELHAHTFMSAIDGMANAKDYIAQAAKWGHQAFAVTDHFGAQSYPEAYHAGKQHGIKIIYGVEANLVDDQVNIAYRPSKRILKEETYVVFDIETTGLSAVYDQIIEIAAVKIYDGAVIDRYESFANPHHLLSATTIELTGITDDMVQNARDIDVVLKEYKKWVGEAIQVAHNASFDTGFLKVHYPKNNLGEFDSAVIDTLELARVLHPELKNHRLNTLCKKFEIALTQHHRAIYDAEATGYLFLRLLKEAEEKGITTHEELNFAFENAQGYKRSRPTHAVLLAQNEMGLKNLFKLISMSHVNYFYRVPRIPKSQLMQLREGLLVGSACSEGELFEAVMQKNPEEVERIASFYDYIEVHPPAVYAPLIEKETLRDERAVQEIIRRLIALGKKLNKPVVATGNVHYLEKQDAIYRKILIASQKSNPLNRVKQPIVHFRTTDEMMEEFSFLGEEIAKEIVIDNTNFIADQIDELKPIKDDLYTPKIEGADREIREMSYKMAHAIYGESLPEIVKARLEKELKSIIGHGFAVIYLISHKLVKKSLDDGYLVGSRGSVGSSLVATMTEITEVNPLPPHYVCPNCKYSHFFLEGEYGSGFDLPDKACPKCGAKMRKDGQDIPFETFLGFKGDKVPDIDLNFSGEYQPHAHNYTKELFGEDYVYRAGTIGTVAEKTAYGYVKSYVSDCNIYVRNAEIERLAAGCVGAKRTTGQHPGGIIVIPDYMDVYDFTPVQYPADDQNSEWRTTHFDFHSIHDNILKLDILGHDDPTVIRMLQDLSGMDPKEIPVDDPEVMKLFSGTESLGVTPEQIMCKTGTLGIPEFGTKFVRGMLEETKPKTFSELVQISGLSHGTDVWLNNASDLIAKKICELKDVIGCRDDIMVYLIYQGLDPSLAFKIMESVRKGKGVPDEWREEMIKNKVPKWYIESCEKIKYMFPKAHAAAYVLMAVRIAYFKVYHPILFYCSLFSVRSEDFDLEVMIRGSNSIRAKMNEIFSKGRDALPKEKSLLTVLELALEMCERGFSFKNIDLYRSDDKNFIVEGNQLLPPFRAIPGLGMAAAESLVKAREQGEFLSKEDLLQRSKISKTILEYLEKIGCLGDMPEQNQLSLF